MSPVDSPGGVRPLAWPVLARQDTVSASSASWSATGDSAVERVYSQSSRLAQNMPSFEGIFPQRISRGAVLGAELCPHQGAGRRKKLNPESADCSQ